MSLCSEKFNRQNSRHFAHGERAQSNSLPDVNSNARSAAQLHSADRVQCAPPISTVVASRPSNPPRPNSQRNQKHIRHNVFKLTDDKRRKDEIHSKHLSKQIRSHLSDEHGEADHDVASDPTKEDLMPFEVSSGGSGGFDKVGYGSRGEPRVSNEDGSEEEGSGEVPKD